jgi:hypothetical protein
VGADTANRYVFAKFQGGLIPAAQAQGGSDVKTIPTYLALLIFGFVYELLLVYDALRAKNTIQVIGIVAMNLAIMVYTAIQGDQIDEAFEALMGKRLIDTDFWNEVRAYLIALPCITALGTLLLEICAWKLYEEFAWTIYKQISADVRLKNRYLIYQVSFVVLPADGGQALTGEQIYIALLKFDFFLFLGFVIQFLVIVHNTSDAEFYLTVAALPIILILLLLAAWSTKRENLIGMALTIVSFSTQARVPSLATDLAPRSWYTLSPSPTSFSSSSACIQPTPHAARTTLQRAKRSPSSLSSPSSSS